MKEYTLLASGYDFPVVEKGQGEALLFVHGSVTDYRYWANEIETFGAHFRAIALSRRHHWPNATQGEFSYRVEDQIDDLIAFTETLDAGPVHLVGHSYGGYLAAALACKRPELLASLTLVEPGGPIEGHEITGVMQDGILRAIDIIKQGQVEEGIKFFHSNVTSTPKWEELPETLREQLVQNALTLPPQHLHPRAPLPISQLSKFNKPTLIMVGENTLSPFPEVARRLHELVPQSTLCRVARASHPVNRENPEAFFTELMTFLKKCGV